MSQITVKFQPQEQVKFCLSCEEVGSAGPEMGPCLGNVDIGTLACVWEAFLLWPGAFRLAS